MNRLLKQFTEMRKVLQMIESGRHAEAAGWHEAAEDAAGSGRLRRPAAGKKRKKGGPWGLIKTR